MRSINKIQLNNSPVKLYDVVCSKWNFKSSEMDGTTEKIRYRRCSYEMRDGPIHTTKLHRFHNHSVQSSVKNTINFVKSGFLWPLSSTELDFLHHSSVMSV